MQRLLLIGDIHTEATRLGHVLAHAAASRPDAILSVGDIVDGPEDVAACMQRLFPDDDGYALESNVALEELLADGVYRWFVGGHTHVPMIRSFGALTVLNPGTLCRRDRPGFLEVDLGAGRGRWYRGDLAGVAPEREVSLAVDFP